MTHGDLTEKYSVDVFSFEDPSEYLREVIGELKRTKRVKLQTFAKGAGIGSVSLLSMICKGHRKLSYPAAEKIARALSLTGRQRKYFLAMQRLQNGKNSADRIEAREEMLRLKSSEQPSLLWLEQYRLIANWYYAVIYILAGTQKMDWDPRAIAKRLGKKVTPKQVEHALEEMVKLELLEKTPDGYQRRVIHAITPEDVKSAAVQRYHQVMAELSIEGLQQPLDEREYNGFTSAIPKREIPVLKEMIRKFRKELNDYFAPLEGESEEVYQVNIHFFKLTERPKEESP